MTELFWRSWTRVPDPMNSSEDWFWVVDCMGPSTQDRWIYLENAYYFKHARDATLFKLMWVS